MEKETLSKLIKVLDEWKYGKKPIGYVIDHIEDLSTPTNEGAKTAYDVLSKYLESCYLTHGEKLSDKYKPYLITAMQEHATQQLAETEAARKEESEGWDRIQKTLEKHLPIEHIVGKDSSKVITEFLEQVLAQLKTTKAELPSEKYISDIAEGLANEYSSDKKDPVWRDIKQDGIKAIKAFIQSLPQSELPTDEEIGEWVCKEFKVDGLDADEDVRTQYGYLPAYFKSFAVWMRSKFPQSDGQRYGELIEWTKGIKPDFHKADNYQHGFHDCAEVLINKLQSLQSKEQEPKQDGQRYGEAITLLKELYESCNPHDVTPHKRAMGVDLGKFYVGGCGIPSNEALHKTKSFLTQEPKQDGQRYGDEDAEKLAMIEFPIPDDKKGDVYFGEKIAFLRVGFKKGYKAIQTLQSKEQEPKGSKRHNCLKNSYSDGAYIKCKICDTTINIKEPNP